MRLIIESVEHIIYGVDGRNNICVVQKWGAVNTRRAADVACDANSEQYSCAK
jgi:hypothetical protein